LPGDVNGDGKTDLVRIFASAQTTDAQVFASNGTGFASVSSAPVGGAWNPAWSDLLLDVDGDGKDDLVILWNSNPDTSAQVNLSSGTTLDQKSNDSLGVAWDLGDRFLVGDVDGDHRQDLVRIHDVSGAMFAQVFLSTGTAFRSASDAQVGGYDPAWVERLLDADGDGRDDLLVLWKGSTQTPTVTAQLDLSNGSTFGGTQVSNAPTGVPWSAANRYFAVDANGDGKKDLVTIYPDGSAMFAQIALATGKGFAVASNAQVGGWNPAWIDLAGDVDGDRRSDLVVLWQDTTQPPGRDARAQVTSSICPAR